MTKSDGPKLGEPHYDLRRLAQSCGANEYLNGWKPHERLVIEFTPEQLACFAAIIRSEGQNNP